MIIKRIAIILVPLIIVILSIVNIYNEFDEFFCKEDLVAYSIPEEFNMRPMYLVKNIGVAENGNILIGAKHGIFMFVNKKCVNYLQIESGYGFKVENNKLIVISDFKQNSCLCYEFKISDKNLKEEADKFQEIKSYYKDYCDKNGFKNSKTVKKGDTEYEYQFYGKVKITKNGESKILNLEKKWFPLPFEYILILDGTLLFAFLVVIVVKLIRKNIQQKQII